MKMAKADGDAEDVSTEETDKAGKRSLVVWKNHQYPFDEREFTAMDFRSLMEVTDEGEPVAVPLSLRFNKSNNWSVPLEALDFLTEEQRVAFLQREEDLEVVEVDH